MICWSSNNDEDGREYSRPTGDDAGGKSLRSVIAVSPEWVELRTEIFRALMPYEDARRAVMEILSKMRMGPEGGA